MPIVLFLVNGRNFRATELFNLVNLKSFWLLSVAKAEKVIARFFPQYLLFQKGLRNLAFTALN